MPVDVNVLLFWASHFEWDGVNFEWKLFRAFCIFLQICGHKDTYRYSISDANYRTGNIPQNGCPIQSSYLCDFVNLCQLSWRTRRKIANTHDKGEIWTKHGVARNQDKFQTNTVYSYQACNTAQCVQYLVTNNGSKKIISSPLTKIRYPLFVSRTFWAGLPGYQQVIYSVARPTFFPCVIGSYKVVVRFTVNICIQISIMALNAAVTRMPVTLGGLSYAPSCLTYWW